MNVGMIPLIIHVPEMAPTIMRMKIADEMPLILFPTHSSNSVKGTLKKSIPNHMAMPDAASRATWLAPRMESLPKK